MSKRNLAILGACTVIIAAILVASYVMASQPNMGEGDDDIVTDTVMMLENGEFQTFYDGCAPNMQTAVGDVDGLSVIWDQYTYGIGTFETIEGTETWQSRGETMSQAYCRHSEWGLLLTISFSDDNSITSLNIGYYEPEGLDKLPNSLTERDVTVDAGAGFPLPGTLTSSETSSNDIAAVIVHGSGPNDRDGTTMVNKPYRDISRGLALKGIDVLAYDKRTFAYPQFSDNPAYATVDDETVDDAVAAVRMLKEMGYSEVYIVGHSMGGMLAPYIVQRCDGDCDGFVSLAGSPRTITDILADQIWAQCRDLPDAERYRAYIKGELAKADALADMTDVERATTMVFGQSGYYIWSINSIDSVSIAGSLSVPMLFLQGSTDIQVLADVDYVRWIGALSDDPAAEFALYDGLNHLFMESDGPYMGTALEYSKRGHVDQAVIDDMAEFIMGS